MEIINYTDLRTNLKFWLNKVVDDVNQLIIKRKDGKDLVLLPLEEYQSLLETSYLLKGKNRDVLLQSIQELENNQTTTQNSIE